MSINLNELVRISNETVKALEAQMSILTTSQNEILKNVPECDKAEVERVKAFTQNVLSEFKKGNVSEAQKLIKNFKYGSKDSEKGI